MVWNEAAESHQQQIRKLKNELRRGERWCEKNDEENAGTYFTEDIPRWIYIHEKSAKHFRRLARLRGEK